MRLRRDRTHSLTGDLELALRHGPGFCAVSEDYSERELRAAWERHREALLAEPREPGHRPWAWWRFEAGRPAVFEPDADDPDYGARLDDAQAEPLGYLAARGELRPDELAALRALADEARARIETDAARETTGMGAVHGPDHRAVKTWAAVEASAPPSTASTIGGKR
jgi:hypothetical protein